MLYSRFFLVIYFIYSNVYRSILISQFIPPPPSPGYVFLKYKFSYLFLAALRLHCCVRAFSSCGEQGLLLVAVRGLLISVASLVVEHGL